MSFSREDDEHESSCYERPDLCDDEMDNEATLKKQLASWQVKNHVPLSHCDELFRILKPHNPELPRCARALIATQRTTVGRFLSDIPPGKYYLFGMEEGIKRVCKTCRNSHVTKTCVASLCWNRRRTLSQML